MFISCGAILCVITTDVSDSKPDYDWFCLSLCPTAAGSGDPPTKKAFHIKLTFLTLKEKENIK